MYMIFFGRRCPVINSSNKRSNCILSSAFNNVCPTRHHNHDPHKHQSRCKVMWPVYLDVRILFNDGVMYMIFWGRRFPVTK